jgi:hypothetical protein
LTPSAHAVNPIADDRRRTAFALRTKHWKPNLEEQQAGPTCPSHHET